jgi:Saxitoxin biosynthesis operon protein SxtJ
MNTSFDTHEDLSRQHQARLSSDRIFGLVIGTAFLIGGLLPTLHGGAKHWWAIVIGGAIFILALVRPSLLHRPNIYWSKFGLLLSRFASPIVMGLLFFAVMTPLAIIFRGFGNDPLRLKFDREATTYWISRAPPGPSPESIKEQF